VTYTTVPPQPAPAASPATIKPSKIWYLIGSLLITVGVGVGIALIVRGALNFKSTIDHFARLKAPTNGPAVLEVKRSGGYWVFYEYTSHFEGQDYSTGKSTPEGLKVTVTDPEGKAIPVDLDVPDFSYPKLDGRAGRLFASFSVTKPGSYTIEVSARNGTAFVVTVGRSGLSTIAKYVLAGLAVGLLGFGTGLAALIVTGVKRGRRKREQMQRAAYGYPGGFGSPPGYGAPSPYGPPPTPGPYGQPPSPYGQPPSPYGQPPSPYAPPSSPSPWSPPPGEPAPPREPDSGPGDHSPWAPPS
jgi:hypothetical protein